MNDGLQSNRGFRRFDVDRDLGQGGESGLLRCRRRGHERSNGRGRFRARSFEVWKNLDDNFFN